MIRSMHIRRAGLELLDAQPVSERFVERVLTSDTAAQRCTVNAIRTPGKGASPKGLHRHPVEQVFYLICGHMTVQIGERTAKLTAGDIVVFPAGVPHRNWNPSAEPSLHLAIQVPPPPANSPFSEPVEL